MVFGYTNKGSAGSAGASGNASHGSGKGSLSGLRSAVRDEGALSERMRLGHITEERHRIEAERAKQGLEEKKRQLQHDRMEVSSHESELRRVMGEFARAEQTATAIKQEMDALIAEHNKSKEEVYKMEQETEALRVRIAHITNDMAKKQTVLAKISSQKSYKEAEVGRRTHIVETLKQKKMREENELHRLHAEIARLESDIKHLESIAQHKGR